MQIRLKKWHTSLFSGFCREIRTKCHKQFADFFCKIRHKNEKIGNPLIHSRKHVDDFWLISARAFQRVFTCKNRRRYSRERASQSLEENSIHYTHKSRRVHNYSFASLIAKARTPQFQLLLTSGAFWYALILKPQQLRSLSWVRTWMNNNE